MLGQTTEEKIRGPFLMAAADDSLAVMSLLQLM